MLNKHYRIFSLLLLISIFSIACSDRGSLPLPGHGPTGSIGAGIPGTDGLTVSNLLWAIGSYLIYLGSAGITLGILGVVACSFTIFSGLTDFRTYFIDGIVLGIVALLIGCAFAYLGEHPWIIITSLVIGVGLVGYRLRQPIEAEFDKLDGKTETVTVTAPTPVVVVKTWP